MANSNWFDVRDRIPTEKDADADGCILAVHKATTRRYFHWRSVALNPYDFTIWTHVPSLPGEAEYSIATNMYDKEELHHNCTVQILHNSLTGDSSIGWWPENRPPVKF